MPDERRVLRDVEAAMARVRRSMGRRTLGRLLLADLEARGEPADLVLFAVLDAVEDGPSRPDGVVSVGDVAERMDLDPSRASRVVAAAVASGHLRRIAAQHDGRQVGLVLTSAGQGVVDLAHRRRQEYFGAAMSSWSPAERAAFAELLTRFTAPFGGPGGPAGSPDEAH